MDNPNFTPPLSKRQDDSSKFPENDDMDGAAKAQTTNPLSVIKSGSPHRLQACTTSALYPPNAELENAPNSKENGGADHVDEEDACANRCGLCQSLGRRLRGCPFFASLMPPSGRTATLLTLLLSASAVFLVARTVLGGIAGPGGTLFALLVLILCALLGMLIVGIILKNVPYNFGQFGRAECYGNNTRAEFVDSLHDLDLASIDEIGHVHDAFDHALGIGSHFHQQSTDPKQLHDYDLDVNKLANMTSGQALTRARRSFNDDHTDASSLGNTSKPPQQESVCQMRYIGHDLDPLISITLRSVCLTVILLMAGLELDPVALWRLSGMVIRATFIPCLVEAGAAAVLAHFILGFPWTVGLMLGFVLAAVSPAVIIPSMMELSRRGFGLDKGIPTMVIAACSADDVVAISGFGIFMGITFADENSPVHMLILHGPIEVLIGVSFGLFWGFLAQWIPNKNHPHLVFFRWLILLSGGLIAVFGSHLIHYEGAGGLATIILAFVAGMVWRREEGWDDHHNPVMAVFKKMWIILEPIIFALIGTEIQVDKMNPSVVGYGLLVLVLAILCRMVGTFFAVTCGQLNTKEKLFMTFAWLPKATVQAAVGPIFLSRAKAQADADLEMISYGEQVLTIAVLSILITAPLGSICIMGLGPRLLNKDGPPSDHEKAVESKEAAMDTQTFSMQDLGKSTSEKKF